MLNRVTESALGGVPISGQAVELPTALSVRLDDSVGFRNEGIDRERRSAAGKDHQGDLGAGNALALLIAHHAADGRREIEVDVQVARKQVERLIAFDETEVRRNTAGRGGDDGHARGAAQWDVERGPSRIIGGGAERLAFGRLAVGEL